MCTSPTLQLIIVVSVKKNNDNSKCNYFSSNEYYATGDIIRNLGVSVTRRHRDREDGITPWPLVWANEGSTLKVVETTGQEVRKHSREVTACDLTTLTFCTNLHMYVWVYILCVCVCVLVLKHNYSYMCESTQLSEYSWLVCVWTLKEEEKRHDNVYYVCSYANRKQDVTIWTFLAFR